jgi:hypothetical protein
LTWNIAFPQAVTAVRASGHREAMRGRCAFLGQHSLLGRSFAMPSASDFESISALPGAIAVLHLDCQNSAQKYIAFTVTGVAN